jgi:lipid-binding SYLF domain-containing protein
MKINKIGEFVTVLLGALALLASTTVAADDAADAKEVVAKSQTTLNNFVSDPDMKWAREHLKNARGVLLVPTYAKAGFIIGGAGGQGVLITRDKSGKWAGPAFYYMGAASIGLQAGVDVAEAMLMIMSDKGIDALLGGDLKLGADARVAAGPVGAGAQAATADVLGYSRSKGLFAGLAFDGSVINPREGHNKAFYGKAVTPTDILIRRNVSNPAGQALVNAVAKAAGDK